MGNSGTGHTENCIPAFEFVAFQEDAFQACPRRSNRPVDDASRGRRSVERAAAGTRIVML